MTDITQNFSQLLLTYGPGAMLDLPMKPPAPVTNTRLGSVTA